MTVAELVDKLLELQEQGLSNCKVVIPSSEESHGDFIIEHVSVSNRYKEPIVFIE